MSDDKMRDGSTWPEQQLVEEWEQESGVELSVPSMLALSRKITEYARGQAACDSQNADPLLFEFGHGDKVVDVGTYGDKHAVFIAPAVNGPGPVGVSSIDSEPQINDRLIEGEKVMTFPTSEQAHAVCDALANKIAQQQAGEPVAKVTFREIAERNDLHKGTWSAHGIQRYVDGWNDCANWTREHTGPYAQPQPDWVPEGWKLVPVEPTKEMQSAYFAAIDSMMKRVEKDPMFGRYESQKRAYKKMLAVAPKRPQPPEGE